MSTFHKPQSNQTSVGCAGKACPNSWTRVCCEGPAGIQNLKGQNCLDNEKDRHVQLVVISAQNNRSGRRKRILMQQDEKRKEEGNTQGKTEET